MTPDGGEDDGSDCVGWGPSSPLATCGSRGGTPSQGALAPRGGSWGCSGRSRAPGGCCPRRTSPRPLESEGPQEGLAVPGGLTGGRRVGEQGRHIWHG